MKKGLLFFPLDVDFFSDEKLEFVSARFGAKGEVCTIRLLMRIYRDGYFIKWDEDAALMFSKSAGKDISPGLANGVVHELVKRGFFDKTLFDSFGVLTSHGIQVRYLNGCKRKKKVEINRDFLLVNPSEYKNLQVVCSSQHFLPECIRSVNISCKNVDVSSENVDIQKQTKQNNTKQNNTTHICAAEKEPAALPASVQEECMKTCGGIGPAQYEELTELVNIHGEARVVDALKIARRRGQRRIAYAAGILRNWRKDGYDGTEERGGHSGRDPEKRDAGGSGIDKYRNITGL